MDHIIRHSYTASINGQSVEALLRSHGYSKSLINRIKLTEDGLMIRGAKVYTTFRMKAGDRLDVTFAEETSSENIVPVRMPLSILYEDEDLMVINKAANVPIHPSQGNFSNSLANGLAWYFKQKQKPFVFRAVNRLDRDTTGLLIVAKNALSSCILSDMVRNRQIHRTYLAAVSGNLSGQPEGTIDVPIARLPGSTIERVPDPVHGEAALTHYELLFYQPQTDTIRNQVTGLTTTFDIDGELKIRPTTYLYKKINVNEDGIPNFAELKEYCFNELENIRSETLAGYKDNETKE